jgi:hypothetical protein
LARPRPEVPADVRAHEHGGTLTKVRDSRRPENQDGPAGGEGGGGSGRHGPLLTLRALVLLLVSIGAAVLVYVVTGELVAAFGVGVPLLVALHELVG